MVGSVYSYLPPAGLTSTGHDHSYHRLAAASALFSPIPLSNLPFPSSMQVVHSVEIGISSCFSLRDIVRWYDVTLPRSTLLTYAYASSYDFVEHRWYFRRYDDVSRISSMRNTRRSRDNEATEEGQGIHSGGKAHG